MLNLTVLGPSGTESPFPAAAMSAEHHTPNSRDVLGIIMSDCASEKLSACFPKVIMIVAFSLQTIDFFYIKRKTGDKRFYRKNINLISV